MGRAGSVKIEPHNNNESVNVCYLSHDTDLPMNENGLFLIL
jgi:hypothetical protein